MGRNDVLRSKGITGSDIAAIAGVSPYATKYDVFLAKTGRGKPVEESLDMVRGRLKEKYLIDMYTHVTGTEVWSSCDDQETLQSSVHPLVIATPDGIADDRVVEAKAPGRQSAKYWRGDDGEDVPVWHIPQVLWQMEVTGKRKADFATELYGDFKIFPTEWHQQLFDSLLYKAEKFWRDHVVKDVAPEADGTVACEEFLSELYPKSNALTVAGTEESEVLVGMLQHAFKLRKMADKMDLEARNLIKEQLGEYEVLESSLGKISWKTNKQSSRVDYKEIVEHLRPSLSNDLLAKYTYTVPGARVFRLPSAWHKEGTDNE